MPTRRSIEALPLRARWLLASALSIGCLLTVTAAAVAIPDPAGAGSKVATPEVPRLPAEPPVTTPDVPPPPDLPDPPPPPERPSLPTQPSPKPTLPQSPPKAPSAGAPEKAPAGGAGAAGGEGGGGKASGRLPRLPVEAPGDGTRSAVGGATDDARSATGAGSQRLPAGRGRTGAGDAASSSRAGRGNPGAQNASAPGAPGRDLQQGTVGAAEPAPLQRLIARVWPAFALAPAETVVALLEGRMGAAIAGLPVVSELLRQVAPQLALANPGGGPPSGTQDPSASAQVSSNRPATDSLTGWITDENRLPLLVAVALCGALILLLVAAVRRDLREMSRYRWRH